MGKKQRDCAVCGAPVGVIGREYCCLCRRKLAEAAARTTCPGCGKLRVLQPDTGRCVLCSRVCAQCGHPVRGREATLCRDCRRKARQAAARRPCQRCGRPGYLRVDTGWCGICSRARQPKDPPRACAQCGRVKRHEAMGLCSACWQRSPERPFVRAAHLAARLADPPGWLDGFVVHVAAGNGPSRACAMVTELGRLLEDEHPNHPQNLLERACRPGRSMGSLARALQDYFTAEALALPTDQAQRLASGRRQRRVDAVPQPLRPAVSRFAQDMMHARERARRAGTKPRSDSTIESALAAIRDFALFLATQRGKSDWALADASDVEAVLAARPGMRARHLSVLRQFFASARRHKIMLADPSRGIPARRERGFSGRTISIGDQRGLFRRWTTGPAVHPHEALLGLLALLHGAASREVRLLRLDDIDTASRSIRLGQRPHPVPLDPASWAALQRCLAHREQLRTGNPHVVVTRGTKALRAPASIAYFSHVLDLAGIATHRLRVTRLADLVNTMDPKLVAAAFGMNPEGVMIYLADQVDTGRLAVGADAGPVRNR
jgi:integrase/ribosomal protein S14